MDRKVVKKIEADLQGLFGGFGGHHAARKPKAPAKHSAAVSPEAAKATVVKALKAPPGIVKGPSLAEDEWFQRQEAEKAAGKKSKAA